MKGQPDEQQVVDGRRVTDHSDSGYFWCDSSHTLGVGDHPVEKVFTRE